MQFNVKSTREGIIGLLASDYEVRKTIKDCNAKSKLYDINNLTRNTYTFDVPAAFNQKYDEHNQDIRNTDYIRESMYVNYPMINVILDAAPENVVVAGGYISSIIRNGFPNGDSDVDLFLYNCNGTEDKVLDIIINTMNDYINNTLEAIQFMEQENENKKAKIKATVPKTIQKKHFGIRYYRNANGIKITGDTTIKYYDENNVMKIEKIFSQPIQIIFRSYSSPSEIIYGFDIGSSAVYYNGKECMCSELGAFALTYGMNIVDMSRRSTTYEKRLQKYYNRGFGIVFPDIDINTCDNMSYIHLNSMILCNTRRINNRLMCEYIKIQETKKSDYDLDLDYMSPEDVKKKNNYQFMWKIPVEEYYIHGTKLLDINSGKIRPYLSITNIFNIQDMFKKVMKITPQTLTKYGLKKGDMMKIFEYAIDEKTNTPEFQDLVKRIIGEYEEYYNKCKGHIYKIKWMREDPTTQVCGSYNPAVITLQEWYGNVHLLKK